MARPGNKIVIQPNPKGRQAKKGLPVWVWWALVCLTLSVLTFWLGYQWNEPQPQNLSKINSDVPLTETKEENDQSNVFVNDTNLIDLLGFLNLDQSDLDFVHQKLSAKGYDQALAGNRFSLAFDDQSDQIKSFTYEANDSILVKIETIPFVDVEVIELAVEIKKREFAGIITSTFWEAILEDPNLHHSLIPLSEEALRWAVDLFHLQAGDRYKFIYEEKTIAGRSVGVQSLLAIQIKTRSELHTVLSYEAAPDSVIFVDEGGFSLRRQFLKAPVKFGIISSAYNPRRLHPVDGVVRGHWGIDYAAPEGSPIYAMADGRIKHATRNRFNGNYVYIKHDEVYTTGYLHLSDFAPGLSVGDFVEQGQVIGFVGQTGLATGPHVCFRFKKNGEEVDFQKHEDSGTPNFVPTQATAFLKYRDEILNQLDDIEIEGGILK